MEKVLVYYKMKDNSNISEYKTVGNYEANSDYITLEFKEKDTGINSKYYIYDDKLVLHRNGSIEMTLEFVLNKETKSLVKTDFGYNMNISINTLSYDFDANQIKLKYELDIDKGNIHMLTLSYSFKK